jgi:hypothetical protein
MIPRSDDRLADVRLIAEAVADVLVERGLVVPETRSAARVMSAAQVAATLGRNRQWVYDHASELGGFRYGAGPKARLGFEAGAVARWMRGRAMSRENQSRVRPRARGSRVEGSDLIPYERAHTEP